MRWSFMRSLSRMFLCCEGHARPMAARREVGSMLSWRGKGHKGVRSAAWEGMWRLGCISPQSCVLNVRRMRAVTFGSGIEAECV